jgi:dihydroorotase-like cyclic amidohydrolase
MRSLITNGTVVNADGSAVADVLVDGEKVMAVGRDLAGSALAAGVETTFDATGKYIIPGAIDVHTHMELPFGGTFAKDTFESGTRAAASVARRQSSTLPCNRRASRCARASTRGTPRRRATRRPTTAST